MSNCRHTKTSCLNQYELIRKYRCEDCNEVMMCSCDEAIGRRFLAHQLNEGTELETQARVPVTLGFRSKICPECRGAPPVAAPVAAIHSRTSKIKRYYWREIEFLTMGRFGDWLDQEGVEDRTEVRKKRKEIEREVVREIKELHATFPKYVYKEESQAEIIRKYKVQVDRLDGVHVRSPNAKGVLILNGSERYTPEQFASRHFDQLDFHTLFLESTPFHVLYGVFMWVVVQDPEDNLVRPVSFGDRNAFEQGGENLGVWTFLPQDFGTPGYGRRRAADIERHLGAEIRNTGDLKRRFEDWLPHSDDFRQYLYAHRETDVDAARSLLDILPTAAILKILRYLARDYWRHYLGWPDLLVYRNKEFFFAEVKSSGDKLSEDQKRWIRDNHEQLDLPFRIVKIHKITEKKKE